MAASMELAVDAAADDERARVNDDDAPTPVADGVDSADTDDDDEIDRRDMSAPLRVTVSRRCDSAHRKPRAGSQ